MKSFKDTDIGREFLAGKCYLRVTKDEWPEFAKRCEAAGIKWQYGVGILESFAADFEPDAIVHMNGERGNNRGIHQRPWLNHKSADEPIRPFSAIARPEPERKIIITTDGRVTTARLIEGKTTIKTATATCSPEDEFEFETGARIAFNRLIPGTIRELKVRVSMDTSAFDAALQSVRDALKDLPNKVKAEKA